MTFTSWWRRHGGALTAVANTTIIGFLGVDKLISEPHKPYWIAAGILIGAIGAHATYSKPREVPKS